MSIEREIRRTFVRHKARFFSFFSFPVPQLIFVEINVNSSVIGGTKRIG